MTINQEFLADLSPRPWTLETGHGLQSIALFIGKGESAIEVAVAKAASMPKSAVLHEAWKVRRAGRAAPVLLVVLHPKGAGLCGAVGEKPPVYPKMGIGQTERLCREVLDLPNRHAALRFLTNALPSLETALPGLNNEGLVALHELEHGTPKRKDWASAGRKAKAVVGRTNMELLSALDFEIQKLDNVTHLLRSSTQRVALAVMLRQDESPEGGTARFSNVSPISYALTKADAENLPWVVVVQSNRLRLYATALDAGVGRRGRAQTFIECQPSLLSDEHLPYLWLLYSADALTPDGSLDEILDSSERFAGSLAKRLRERIYDTVVPTLAKGIAEARGIKKPNPDELEHTYKIALTVLFRLLFIAYAEDCDLLPYRLNEAYRRRSLKQKAQDLAKHMTEGIPVSKTGSHHWQEVSMLSQAVSVGNQELGVPAYNGGLFSSDVSVSLVGAELGGGGG